MMKNKKNKILSIGTVISILIIWFVVTSLKLVDPKLVPHPVAVVKAFIEIVQNGYRNYTLLEHLLASLGRLLIALVVAILAGVPLGLYSGYNPKIKAILDPIIEFYRPLPPLAYYTILILWLGIDNASKIVLLFLASFAPIYIACVSAVEKVKQDYLKSAYVVGANEKQVFFHVIFPACLPDIFIGIRTGLGVAYTTLVSSEMVAAKSGIGWMVLDASRYLRSDIIFLGIIIMGITGVLLDKIIQMIELKLIPWKGKE